MKFLNDDDIDIVIEVMGGIEPTVDWLRESLKRKNMSLQQTNLYLLCI